MKVVDPTGWTRSEYLDFYSQVWGCPCIPVKKDKKAMVKWAPYQTSMPTQDDYAKWFESWGAWGLTIILKNGLFSVDLDTEEVYQHLKSFGAFPRGACIYKSARGYHVIMRATQAGANIPYSVVEHSEELTAIDPVFFELGIGGINHLSIMPDTPQRLWLPGQLFDEPAEVDYEEWLEEHIGWSKRQPGARVTEGDIHIPCVMGHDKDTDSMVINATLNSAHCFGCGWHGNLWQLADEYAKRDMTMPIELTRAFDALDEKYDVRTGDFRQAKRAIPPPLIDRLISGGRYGVTQIAADSGEGKTTIVCCIAASVATNKPTFGNLPTRQGVVTIIDYEGIRDMLSLALEQLLGSDVDKVPPNQINIVSKDKGQFNVMVTGDRDYIIRQLKRYKTDLCILDSLIWFLDDPNEQPQVDACKKWLERIQQEVGCSILIMMHTSKNPFGHAWDSPYGILGNMLKRWVSSKLGFGRLKGSDYYSMIEGRTRQWGQVRHFLGYREDRRSVVLLDTDDIPTRYLADLQRGIVDSTARLIEQVKIIAKEEGIQVTELAELLQVDRRSITYWASGEKQPSAENYNAIVALRDRIINDPTGVKVEIKDGHSMGTKSVPASAQNSSLTPTEKVEQAPIKSPPPTGTPIDISFSLSVDDSDFLKLAQCDKCKLKGTCKGAVEGRGYGKNGIMIIGEAPGQVEDEQENPVVGPSGEYLNELTDFAGIDTDDSRITNVCLCYPGKDSKGKDKKPPLGAIRACLPRLKAEIGHFKSKLIIMMGEIALQALFPDYSLSRMHGKRWQIADTIYVAMYPPAAGVRSPYYRPTLKYDWQHFNEQAFLSEIEGDYRIGDDSHFDKTIEMVVDVETADLKRGTKLLGGSLSPEQGKATYFTQDGIVRAIEKHKPFTLGGHGLKFDIQRLAENGLNIDNYEYNDSLLLAYCMAYDDLRLKTLETQELNLTHPTFEQMAGESGTLEDKPVEVVGKYCNQDTDSGGRLWRYLVKEADKREMELYTSIDKPLMPALVKMEQKGIKVDIEYLHKWRKELIQSVSELQQRLEDEHKLSLEVLNSPKKLGDWLTNQGIKLPKTELSKQAATGKRLLAQHIDELEVIPVILEYRHAQKLISTYADALIEFADDGDIIHTQYNQARVVTGRLSSSNPNLQNQPHNYEARRPFIARPGHKLLRIDYSQIDMRLLAYISGDPLLIAAYERDEDIHNWMADQLFGDHIPKHRYNVKGASYAAIYGGEAKALYEQQNAPMGEFNIAEYGKPPSMQECKAMLANYRSTFVGVFKWHEEIKAQALQDGYISDYYGRRRYLPNLASSDRRMREAALREVINFPIAGPAASIFKLSIIATYKIDVPVLNVHDELIFDIPEEDLDKLRPQLEAAMQGVNSPAPLKVDVQIGVNLGDLT